MTYSNGSVGVCECGQLAIDACQRCLRMLCDSHARLLPPAPAGVSPDALSRFEIAIRAGGPYCQGCRTDIGSFALAQATSVPRAPLPEHWLDRAIALNGDQSRSPLEKLEDAELPATLNASEVAQEFLHRIGRQPTERVPISPPKMMRNPDYAEGWSVDCRRTQYVAGASNARYSLPCLISTVGELLGPTLDADDRHGPTWRLVPESDIELARLVTGVAQLLLLSAFVPSQPAF
ncbi:MAG: hypothetical protein ACRDMZ_15340 [Solirubrobacteraceae bacterium]